MDINWAANMMGVPLSEKRMADITFPRSELLIHITTKTVQSGALLGTAMVAPIFTAVKGERDLEGYKKWANTCGYYGVMVGLVSGPLLTWLRLRASDITTENVTDRCYRLRFSKNQLRVDRLSVIGAVAGYAAATHLGEGGQLGALLGVSGGVLLAAAFNMII